MIPGSPLPIYIGPGAGKRSRALGFACPNHYCNAKAGHHCWGYAWTMRGYEHTQVAEFHQERIDLSLLCLCGKPSTYQCDAPLTDAPEPVCLAPMCSDCATVIREDHQLCKYHTPLVSRLTTPRHEDTIGILWLFALIALAAICAGLR